jgi:hypothetical protein
MRFTSRGRLGWYILENIISGTYELPTLFIAESETSANSLWEHLKTLGKSCVVLSAGSVGATPPIPVKYSKLVDKRLIIDYDGDEDKYNERLINYKVYENIKPIKVILPKGEDLNSLYASGKINLINNLLK